MIKALKNNIIVKPYKKPVPKSGIMLPESYTAQTYGHVVSIGSEVKTFKLKDFVFFTLHGGKRFTYKDQEYIRFKEDEVYAVIE